MAWAPILTRDNGIPSPDSRDTPMRKGEEAQASGKLLKKRRASMAVWSIKYNDDGTCAILLNLTFGLRTGQTLSWLFCSVAWIPIDHEPSHRKSKNTSTSRRQSE